MPRRQLFTLFLSTLCSWILSASSPKTFLESLDSVCNTDIPLKTGLLSLRILMGFDSLY